MGTFFINILFVTLVLLGCKSPSVFITDEYVSVVKPGQIFGIVEVNPIAFDSILQYPTDEQEVMAFSLVDRVTHKQLSENADVKVYFNRKHKKYCWMIHADPVIAKFDYIDTIRLRPNTWYRVTTEKSNYDVYFLWSGKKGDFITNLKPKPGAF